ncbi:mitochondrial carrier homolog 1-like isoform X3 [Rhodnius prolixus]|uniref:mitochondrial carrier homolog 1-like isoform X3 n=1 Tax=Rhodnius prolixus TaxID=13249 RepID=UPI003D18BB15
MVDSINLYNENTKYANLYTHAISGIKDILWFPFEMCGNLVKLGYIPKELFTEHQELDKTIYEIPSRLEIVWKVFADEGIHGFTRGLYSTLISNFIYESTLLSFHKYFDELFQGYLKDFNINRYITRLLKICSSQTVAVVLSQPFEVLAALQVGQYVGKETLYSGFLVMPFIQILIQKGISGYFCGTTPRLIRYVWLNIVVDAVSLTLAWILGDQNVSYISNSQEENELHSTFVKYKTLCIALSKLTATENF